MDERPFAGATQDPVALLQQLIRHVADLEVGQDDLRERMSGVESRLGSVDKRLGSVEKRLDSVETRLDALEGEVRATRQVVEVGLSGMRETLKDFGRGTEQREEALRAYLVESGRRSSFLYVERLREELASRISKVETRLDALEAAVARRPRDDDGAI